MVIEETIRPTANGRALSRSFEIKSAQGKYPLALKFQSSEKLSVSSNRQILKGPGRLTVTLTPRHDP